MAERTPMDLALKSLSRQAYSRSKMVAKLNRAGFDDDQTNQCVGRLENWGYLNDREFGIGRIATLQARFKSRNFVAGDLESQGLSSELVQELLAEFYPEEMELEIARKLLQKKQRPKHKGYDVLVRAGFSESTVHRCFPELTF
ncbi:MAG: regulatory protein RecX [Bacteroidota bacterium]